MTTTSEVSEAARLLASRRKRSGRKHTPRFRCLRCDAALSASQVRTHKCEKEKADSISAPPSIK